MIYTGFPSFFWFVIRARSYSNFLPSAVHGTAFGTWFDNGTLTVPSGTRAQIISEAWRRFTDGPTAVPVVWQLIKGWSFFWRPFFFFFGARFFFCGWLVSARTVPLLQAVAGKSWNFCRVQGFATQHSFWGLGFCNPTLLLGLKVLQPNIPFRASGFCNSTFLLGLKVLQPNTSFRAPGCCKPTLLLGFRVLQPNTPFRASGVGTPHSS